MIRNKKTFFIGLAMLISFCVVYIGIMSPSFGNGRNGLEFADDMFNSLSKGSAYFIGEQMEKAEKENGKAIDLAITAKSEEEAANWAKLYEAAGAEVKLDGNSVNIKGDFGKILTSALTDCDSMYNNQGDTITAKYGYDSREATYNWYNSFKKMDDQLKNKEMFPESSVLNNVMKKGVEPAYNYYGIEIKHVKENKATVSFMLIFYLIYTLWYGFGLYYLFDGLGISTSKSPKKAEA
ncbi:hypothetical protein DCCM_3685 [Desulfocucumis palustris]|uniref:Uncharacterized protein n=1 Tax=Desulfocucumis palustris TaxID=1898651 RepID=A0A2L2XJW3_9FIRM|nr:hypothetical protein [Desulfocucumis palustris]GBF34566.1 hypothetical protein DCCM_3685 [Desulfocucumis palustris]